MPDAALGEVHVVVEEDVAGAHRLKWIVAGHRMDQRRVRPAGQLAQLAIVDTGAEVVRVADHRRARGTADRRLHFPLDGRECALHDLQYHRIDAHARVTTRLPSGSTDARKPGCTGTVEPYSSTIAGPGTRSPGARSSRQ